MNVIKSKLTGFVLAALLLPVVPASAASFFTPEPAPALRLAESDATPGNDCALPQLSLRIDTSLIPHASAENEFTGGSRFVESRWTVGATSEWHAGMNRAVDRLINPPENVNVYAVQTEDRLNNRLEGTHGTNATLAGFEIVVH